MITQNPQSSTAYQIGYEFILTVLLSLLMLLGS